MRCSKLCLALLLVGIGGAAVLAASGYVKEATLISVLPILACPLMCVAMMILGRKCNDGECHTDRKKPALPRPHVER